MSAGELLLVIGSLAVAAIGVRAALRTGGQPPVPPSEVSVPEFGLAGMFLESGYRAAHEVPFGPVQIEGTPLAQTAFDRSWSDWGRGERVRDAHAAHLAELEAEHEVLRGRDERSGE